MLNVDNIYSDFTHASSMSDRFVQTFSVELKKSICPVSVANCNFPSPHLPDRDSNEDIIYIYKKDPWSLISL